MSGSTVVDSEYFVLKGGTKKQFGIHSDLKGRGKEGGSKEQFGIHSDLQGEGEKGGTKKQLE